MTLVPGTKLNSYEIIGPLGAGGMGEVYRARDTKLDRQVALKLVLEVFTADRDRAARFEREARTLAALNHPNIATLHGLEHADGRHFLVMELVEGETLAERIARHPGGLPLEEAFQIARQMADALEAAHEKGIVHRDLKPANVKITPDDKVKVLDFGLAKASDRDGANSASAAMSPTVSAFSQAGMILGTASYMSPEQARGYAADHRSDIFAFGIVLYEMLTGRQPFPGETISDVLAAVLARDPDLGALPADLSPRLIDLVKRCLEKNPKKRWQAIGDVRYELESLIANPRAVPLAAVHAAAAPQSFWRRALPIAGAALAAGLIVAAVAWVSRPTPPVAPVMQFALDLPEGHAVQGTAKVAISPDGTRLAYVSGRQIWLRSMGSPDIKPVAPATPSAAILNLTFSPDGQWLVYTNPLDIFRVPSAGGLPVRVHTLDVVPLGMTWTGDSLVISQRHKIIRVGANGGESETLLELPDDQRAVRPQLLPDGITLLFGIFPATRTETRPIPDIVIQRIGDQNRTVLLTNADDALFVAPGHLLFAREGVLYATAFDPARHAVSKDVVPILPGVRRNGLYAQYALSATGILTYVAGPLEVAANPARNLILAGRDGTMEYLKPASGNYSEPRMSPDGRYVAYVNQEETATSIWVYDLQGGGAARRLTFVGRDRAPVWTPDSTRVTFQSERDGTTAIYTQRVDGRGVAEQLTTPESGGTHTPQAWSPDGNTLLLDVKDKTRYTLMVMRSGAKALVPFADVSSISETGATFSPDGRWVAYTRDENGATAMVLVQPFPATGALFQISKSTEDGHHPTWSRDGKELLYTPGGGFISVPMKLSPEIVPGEPAQRPRPFTNMAPSVPRTYDSADGGKILGLSTVARGTVPVGGTAAPARVTESIQIIVNWIEELKAKVKIR